MRPRHLGLKVKAMTFPSWNDLVGMIISRCSQAGIAIFERNTATAQAMSESPVYDRILFWVMSEEQAQWRSQCPYHRQYIVIPPAVVNWGIACSFAAFLPGEALTAQAGRCRTAKPSRSSSSAQAEEIGCLFWTDPPGRSLTGDDVSIASLPVPIRLRPSC